MDRSFILFALFTSIFLLRLPRANCSNSSNTSGNITSGNITIGKIRLNIGALFSKIKDDRFGYNRSVTLAKSLVENSTRFKTLTDRYELNLEVKDTYDDPSIAIAQSCFLSSLDPIPTAVIGPGNSILLDYAAVALMKLGNLLVPFTTQIIEDPKKTGFVMSSSTGINQEIAARMAFMKKFNWKRAAVIYEKRNQFLVTFADKMFDQLRSNRVNLTGSAAIEVRVQHGYVENPIGLLRTKLLELKSSDTKIYFAEVADYTALVLFCQVYELGMYGADVVWILNSNARDVDLWFRFNNTRDGQIVSCSKDDIYLATKRAFIFQRQIIREDDNRTDSGLTAKEFIQKLNDMKMREYNMKNMKNLIVHSSLSFDAFWAVAIALNNSIELLEKRNLTLDHARANRVVKSKMGEVDFEGIGGPYSYSKGSSTRDGTIAIFQFRGNKTRIGQHVTITNQFNFLYPTSTLWENGKAPNDKSTVKIIVLKVEHRLYVAVTTAASIGIFLGVLFLTFNLVYRKYKFIKLSAPLFNNIIASGCIMCLVSIFFFGVHDISNPDTNFALVCKARAWTLTIGFSCAFGAMFVKTWRIYKICTNKKLRVKLGPLSDWYLLSLVGIIIVVDLIILITWELSDPIQHRELEIQEKKKEKYSLVLFTEVIRTCHAKNMIVWLTVVYVYKGILILYGLFLAYETRNVIYAHLNDSRVIGICVYNVVVLSVIGAFLSLLLEYKNYEEMYIVLSVCIIFPAVGTICLMMFPKIAYRCKTNNLDDTETIANGMTTVRGSFDMASTCHTVPPPPPQPAPLVENTLEITSHKNVQFSYQNGIEDSPSESPTSSKNISKA